MGGIPREVQQWAVATTRGELVRFMNDLSVPESILQPYIVKKTEAVLPPVAETQSSANDVSSEEPMELDSPATSTSSNESASISLSEVDSEPLPAVVIGSEAWHSQVPAVCCYLILTCAGVLHKFFVGMGSYYRKGLSEAEETESTTTIQ